MEEMFSEILKKLGSNGWYERGKWKIRWTGWKEDAVGFIGPKDNTPILGQWFAYYAVGPSAAGPMVWVDAVRPTFGYHRAGHSHQVDGDGGLSFCELLLNSDPDHKKDLTMEAGFWRLVGLIESVEPLIESGEWDKRGMVEEVLSKWELKAHAYI